MSKLFLVLSAANGFLAVALGAFGAHGLHKRLDALADGAKRLDWWQTAAAYHLAHALALGLVAITLSRAQAAAAPASNATATLGVAGWAFLAGVLLFSGSLYTMAVTGLRALGAVTPFGGLAFLVGWAALFVAALRS